MNMREKYRLTKVDVSYQNVPMQDNWLRLQFYVVVFLATFFLCFFAIFAALVAFGLTMGIYLILFVRQLFKSQKIRHLNQ